MIGVIMASNKEELAYREYEKAIKLRKEAVENFMEKLREEAGLRSHDKIEVSTIGSIAVTHKGIRRLYVKTENHGWLKVGSFHANGVDKVTDALNGMES